MTQYKREKPRKLLNIHTCYKGHDCEENMSIENHLAEALYLVDGLMPYLKTKNDYTKRLDQLEHHIRMAWQKSK